MVYKPSKLTLEELVERLEGLIGRMEAQLAPVERDKEAETLADRFVRQQVLERGGECDD